MAWFGLAKIALQAGGKIYANRQKTKMDILRVAKNTKSLKRFPQKNKLVDKEECWQVKNQKLSGFKFFRPPYVYPTL